MARQLRIEFPGALYHITSRGNGKQPIFLSDKDRKIFIGNLKTAYERFTAIFHVYCLMENHYHFLLETRRGNLSRIMHFINTSYTAYFNKRHGKSGHLFQGRFNAILVEADAYAQELSRYIHLNPVRAGIVDIPERYPWSSYGEYIGLKYVPPWLETKFVLSYFGRNLCDAQLKYSAFVASLLDKGYKSPLEELDFPVILGHKSFIEQIKKTFLSGKKAEREVPALRDIKIRPRMERIRDEVEKFIGRPNKYSKKISIFLCHKFTDKRLKEIGLFFGMDESAVSQVSRRIRGEMAINIDLGNLIREIENKIFLSNV
ncbi:MAG: transposase [Candidatus Aminicenantes bacterium]|jgi:putative transposase|nr:transposase [Candidatus Aminicenantes bacterium]